MRQVNFNAADIIQQSALVASTKRAKEVRDFLKEASDSEVSFVVIINQEKGQRSTSVAFKSVGKNMISVATAFCHPDDDFDAAYGMAQAAERLYQGASILMFVPDGKDAKKVVEKAFVQQ